MCVWWFCVTWAVGPTQHSVNGFYRARVCGSGRGQVFFPGKCARVMGGRFYGNKLGKMRCTSMLLWWLEVDKIFMTFLRSYFRELSFEK